jgi:hypothetical protein
VSPYKSTESGSIDIDRSLGFFNHAEHEVKTINVIAVFALFAVLAALPALTQEPKPERLRGVIERVDGDTVMAKSDKGAEITLHLAAKTRVFAIDKASLADIKPGDFIGSGAVPQPDGTQKAVEVHIFSEALRGTGEGFKPWGGAANGTMTNGTVGATVTGVTGPIITVIYKGGEQKIVVPPDAPIVRFELGDMSTLKPGAAFAVVAAVKQPDGSFGASGISVGRNGAVPP